MLAHGDVVGAGGDDLADGAAVERGVDLEGGDVGLHVVHPTAHVGVERHDDIAHEDLTVGELRQVDGLEAEVVGARRALGARGEDDLTGGGGQLGHGPQSWTTVTVTSMLPRVALE